MSNTGRLNKACILLEQKLDRDLFNLTCHQHINEPILRGYFENKFSHITTSSNLLNFKNFKKLEKV